MAVITNSINNKVVGSNSGATNTFAVFSHPQYKNRIARDLEEKNNMENRKLK